MIPTKRQRYWMCLRKRQLDCIEAHDLSKRYGQRWYICPICGWYHLTSRK